MTNVQNDPRLETDVQVHGSAGLVAGRGENVQSVGREVYGQLVMDSVAAAPNVNGEHLRAAVPQGPGVSSARSDMHENVRPDR